jgi:hypothetical protein
MKQKRRVYRDGTVKVLVGRKWVHEFTSIIPDELVTPLVTPLLEEEWGAAWRDKSEGEEE